MNLIWFHLTEKITRRLRNIEIRVGNEWNNFRSNPLCAKMERTAKGGEKVELSCPTCPYGQYVSIQVMGRREKLTLCEVEVDAFSLISEFFSLMLDFLTFST